MSLLINFVFRFLSFFPFCWCSDALPLSHTPLFELLGELYWWQSNIVCTVWYTYFYAKWNVLIGFFSIKFKLNIFAIFIRTNFIYSMKFFFTLARFNDAIKVILLLLLPPRWCCKNMPNTSKTDTNSKDLFT